MADDIETRTKVTILTDTYLITGYVDLVPGARITDYLNEAKNFFAITDAEVREADGRVLLLHVPFLNVNRDHVVIVTPGQ